MVAGRVLLESRRAALCYGDDAVRVGLRLLHEALLVGKRLVGIALRGNHGVRHLHVGEIHRSHGDAGIVEIERALNELLRQLRDMRAGGANQHIIQGTLADDLAESALADAAQGGLRIRDLEQHLYRIGVLVLHRETQLDQVDVRRQDARLVVAAIDVRDIDLGQGLDRPRPAPPPALPAHMDELAETLDDAALGGLDLEEAAGKPQEERHDRNDGDERAAAFAATRTKQRLEPALPFLQALIKTCVRAGPLAPGTLLTAAGLIPSHRTF